VWEGFCGVWVVVMIGAPWGVVGKIDPYSRFGNAQVTTYFWLIRPKDARVRM